MKNVSEYVGRVHRCEMATGLRGGKEFFYYFLCSGAHGGTVG